MGTCAGGAADGGRGVRINKYLAMAGVCSRRAADRLIGQKRVLIDGRTAKPGDRVFDGQKVALDKTPVFIDDEEIYIAFYKPRGVVCTTADEENGKKIKNAVDFIGYEKRIYPIGRLDMDSEGLLLLTNQGDAMEKILRGSNGHEKEYFVRVDHKITDEFIKEMGRGVPVLGVKTKKCKVWKEDDESFHIILTQGLNRQIRRMCAYFGYEVSYLRRDRIMNITLSGLKRGEYRRLTDREAKVLKSQL